MNQRGHALSHQCGMSILELLVGVAVGLIVVAGAVKLMVDTLGGNRRLLLETRVNQDLRAAADLIARDLRRAGYWTKATSGIFGTGSTSSPLTNPYRAIDVVGSAGANEIEYQYQRPVANAGFAVVTQNGVGVLAFSDGSVNPRPITDPKVIDVTNLTVTEVSRVTDLYTFCACMTKINPADGEFYCKKSEFEAGGKYYDPSDPGDPDTPLRPTITIRQYDVVLAGRSTTDPSVVREIRESVRVRNDLLSGKCPRVPT